jgi:hypothetical protein
MKWPAVKQWRRWNVATHRDLGYFFSTLIIVYCLSGIALNHVDEWNPDFVITYDTIPVDQHLKANTLTETQVKTFSQQVGETTYKVYDAPTSDQVKIYYDNASLHLHFNEGYGVYERIFRRPLFYGANVIHRNSVKGWKWVSDVFAVLLMVISITGLFVLKGKHGIWGRGKWWMLAGALPPLVVLIIHEWN